MFTTVAVLALCGFAVLRGWEVTGFASAEKSLRAGGAVPGGFAAWQDVPGISSAALRASLTQMSQSMDPAVAESRGDALGEVLAVQPSSSMDWLSLAGTRVATGDSKARILSALRMSYLTGPNEGGVMFERGLFGLLQWGILPEAVRDRTSRDLAGAILDDAVSDSGLRILKSVLAGKPAETRSELTAQLASQRVPPTLLARIGL
jgi:hypothetical protein